MPSDLLLTLSMFGIYAIYVLLPIIPTVVIYKLFPDSTVSIGGMVQGLRLNATGAFGAYVATVLLGTWIAKSAVGIVQGYEQPMWTVNADVQLRDASGQPVNDAANLEQLTVNVVPPIFGTSDRSDNSDPAHPVYFKHVEVKVPVFRGDFPCLKYSVPHYAAYSRDIAEGKVDAKTHVIDLKMIKLVKMPTDYVASASPIPAQTAAASYPGGAHP
jgi:hypothetical protein